MTVCSLVAPSPRAGRRREGRWFGRPKPLPVGGGGVALKRRADRLNGDLPPSTDAPAPLGVDRARRAG